MVQNKQNLAEITIIRALAIILIVYAISTFL